MRNLSLVAKTNQLSWQCHHEGLRRMAALNSLRAYRRLNCFSHTDKAKRLVIAGSGRSGTTWLAEILAAIPKSTIIFEPLHPSVFPPAKHLSGSESIYKPRTDDWPEGKRSIQLALDGRMINSWTMRATSLSSAVKPEYVIMKVIRANLMLDWLVETFSLPTPLLVIRHPCAVIASIKNYAKWPQPHLNERFLNENPQFQELVARLKTEEELRAAQWCIENRVPLLLSEPRPFRLLSYEDLVLNPNERVEELFAHWQVAIPEAAYSAIERRSVTARSDVAGNGQYDPLSSWQNHLNSEEVRRILYVVREFGLDFYNEDAEPDYARLYGQSPARM